MVDTQLFRKSGATPDMLPMDDGNLSRLARHPWHKLTRLRSQTPRWFHGLAQPSRSPVPEWKVRLGELGRAGAQGTIARDLD
jgi:hypothetical protein